MKARKRLAAKSQNTLMSCTYPEVAACLSDTAELNPYRTLLGSPTSEQRRSGCELLVGAVVGHNRVLSTINLTEDIDLIAEQSEATLHFRDNFRFTATIKRTNQQ